MTTEIAKIILVAYNAGLLQDSPMTVAGVTASLQIFKYHNQLTVQTYGKLMSVSVYDSDTPELQETTISNLVADVLK